MTKSVELRIGCQHYGTSSLLKLGGAAETRLAKDGFKITWRDYPAGPQLLHALDALGQGEIDFCCTGEVPPILAQAVGVPLLYVGCEPPAPTGEGLVVRADSDIESIADLRNRRVALNHGSNVHYLLIQALKARGLRLDDVFPVYLPPTEAMQQLKDGRVDAWAIWDPLLTAIVQDGGVRQLLDGRDLVSNRQFHIASQAFARRHPAAVAALLDELGAAGEYAATRGLDAARAMAGALGIAVPALEASYSRMSYGTAPLSGRVIRQQQGIADNLLDKGVLATAVRIDRVVWADRY